MIVELGAFALALALALSVAQAVLGGAARWRRDVVLRQGAVGAALAAALAVAAAFAALTTAYVTSDFSVANVALNSHTDKPLGYKIAGVWGNHEGSLLLWCLAMTGFGAAVAVFGRRLPFGLHVLTVACQGALGALFLAFAVFTSSPFARLEPFPLQGKSLNPLLQDPALAIHPPLLYAGYVGFSVVFSFAVAALIEGRVDAAWARWVRPWTLAAWSLLTVGITLGAFWAYYELGWGGWWFWDPVENASFMPWLAGTALLHSAIVTEKRGALAGWTVFLALAAFSFSMLGAFLVRSGVLTSVHAFAVDPERGRLLLAILGVTAGSAFALFAWRAPALKSGGVFAPVSRESALVLNNIFLSAATMTVLLGTLYPLMVEAATGRPISVGPPYFNLTFAPLMAVVLLILPLGPLLAWKRADALGALQRLWAAAAVALAAGVAVMALASPRSAVASVGAALGAWLILGALTEPAGRARLGRLPLGQSLKRLGGMSGASWGMLLAHLGLGVFVIGATVETSLKVEAAAVLQPGGVLRLGGYELTLEDVVPRDGPNFLAERGVVSVTRNGDAVCRATPERRFYPAGEDVTSEVALCGSGLDDLYLVLGERRPGEDGAGGWLLRAYSNPLAKLILLGPALMALGGLLSLGDRRLRTAASARRGPSLQPLPAT